MAALKLGVSQYSSSSRWISGTENIGNSLWNFVASWPRSSDTATSGLKAAICEYPLPFMLYSIPLSLIGLLEPENIGIAFGISLRSGLQAEIYRYFQFSGRHLGFPASVKSDGVFNRIIVFPDPENMSVSLGTLLLARLRAEI